MSVCRGGFSRHRLATYQVLWLSLGHASEMEHQELQAVLVPLRHHAERLSEVGATLRLIGDGCNAELVSDQVRQLSEDNSPFDSRILSYTSKVSSGVGNFRKYCFSTLVTAVISSAGSEMS